MVDGPGRRALQVARDRAVRLARRRPARSCSPRKSRMAASRASASTTCRRSWCSTDAGLEVGAWLLPRVRRRLVALLLTALAWPIPRWSVAATAELRPPDGCGRIAGCASPAAVAGRRSSGGRVDDHRDVGDLVLLARSSDGWLWILHRSRRSSSSAAPASASGTRWWSCAVQRRW